MGSRNLKDRHPVRREQYRCCPRGRHSCSGRATSAEAQLKLDTNNLHRIEPLLQKQYVTVEQVDQTSTEVHVAQGRYDEAQAALLQAQAQLAQATLHHEEASSQAAESQAKLGQAIHAVDRVETPNRKTRKKFQGR